MSKLQDYGKTISLSFGHLFALLMLHFPLQLTRQLFVHDFLSSLTACDLTVTDCPQLLFGLGIGLHWGSNQDGDHELLTEDQCLQSSYIVWYSCQLHIHQPHIFKNPHSHWTGEFPSSRSSIQKRKFHWTRYQWYISKMWSTDFLNSDSPST